jgi:hypothetical protein
MWKLENRCLTTDNMLEMPIHNVLVHDQFKLVPTFISFKHYTLSEPLIVIYELKVLLAHERVHLGHSHFVLPEPAHLKVLDVMLQVLVQSLP